MIHPRRPLTVLCPDWEPTPGAPESSKRCGLYLDATNGCQMPKNLVCVEWARKNVFSPALVPDALRREQAENIRKLESMPSALDLLTTPAEAGKKEPVKIENGFLSSPDPKKVKAKDVARATNEALLPVPKEYRDQIAHNEAFRPAKWIEPEAIASLEELGAEVTLAGEAFGDVTFVKSYTGKDRKEITYKDAATLRLLVDAFPGAHVAAFVSTKSSLQHASDQDLYEDAKVKTNDLNVCAACGCKSAHSLKDKPCDKCGASKATLDLMAGWDES